MGALTDRQQQVYLKLKREWARLGRQPPLSELAVTLDMHYVSLKQHLQALETKGYLTINVQGKGRSPVLTLNENGLPLVGEIAAGGLHDAEQNVEAYLNLPAAGRFALRVKGDSMSEFIHDGDVVILKQSDFSNGDICAVYVDGATTLKYVYTQGATTLLKPHNPSYHATEVATADLHVQGVYHGNIRGAVVNDFLKEDSHLN